MVIYCAIKCIVSRYNVFLSGFSTNNPIHIYFQVSKIDDISLTMTFELYMDLMWEESRWAVIGGELVTWPWSSSLIGQDRDQRDLAALGPGRQLHGLDQLRAADVAARHPGELWLAESCCRCWAVIGWELRAVLRSDWLRSVLSFDWLRCCRSTCASSSASGRSWPTWPGSSSSRTGRFCTQCPQRWATLKCGYNSNTHSQFSVKCQSCTMHLCQHGWLNFSARQFQSQITNGTLLVDKNFR